MFRLDVPTLKNDIQCRAAVMGAVLGVDPAAQCDVNIDERHLRVESRFPPSDFVEALEEVGYTSFIAQV
jgi:hypothetical protein